MELFVVWRARTFVGLRIVSESMNAGMVLLQATTLRKRRISAGASIVPFAG